MNKIEQYDIITLKNGNEYTVIKILNEQQKKYYLLAPIDEAEEPDMENIKIMEEVINGNKTLVQDIKDEELLKKLSKMFLQSLRESLE